MEMKTLKITSRAAQYSNAGSSTLLKGQPNQNHESPAFRPASTVFWTSCRSYSVHSINKALELVSCERAVKIEKTPMFQVTYPEVKGNKPLVIIPAWMLAKQKHLLKFAELYMDQGFDVLNVCMAPWQMLWPVKGTQVIAADLVQFLHVNKIYRPLLVHGFSVGGYQWAEALVKIDQNREKYHHILDRLAGQIWDSAADITEIPVGFPKAVFPNSPILETITQKYIRYHLRTFHDVATIHYHRAREVFLSGLVRAPALLFFSKNDPIGCVESNMRLKETWDAHGVVTHVKCWDKSLHVMHLREHRKEYLEELFAFLNGLNVLQNPEKIKAKL